MQPKADGVYKDRLGREHGPLSLLDLPFGEPFRDPKSGLRWFSGGNYLAYGESDYDLIEEVVTINVSRCGNGRLLREGEVWVGYMFVSALSGFRRVRLYYNDGVLQVWDINMGVLLNSSGVDAYVSEDGIVH